MTKVTPEAIKKVREELIELSLDPWVVGQLGRYSERERSMDIVIGTLLSLEAMLLSARRPRSER